MVPERERGLWTPALDHISVGKLYRILVEMRADTAPPEMRSADLEDTAHPAPIVNAILPPDPAAPTVAAADKATGASGIAPEDQATAPPIAAGGGEAAARPVADTQAGSAALPPVVAAADSADSAGAAAGLPNGLVKPSTPRDQRWVPESGTACTADGDPSLNRNGALIIDGCAPGALIAKIGGSTADLKPDKDKVVLFGVGRHCVFSIGDANKAASLYLGINDTREGICQLQGQLEVTIFEAL
jgi:hypothetical protein